MSWETPEMAALAAEAKLVDVRLYRSGHEAITASWWDTKAPSGTRPEHGVVDMCSMGGPGDWYVNRAVVYGTRGKGIGSKMLQLALRYAVLMGATCVKVTPGGYDNDTEKQFKFYEKNGFKVTDERGLMEWRP